MTAKSKILAKILVKKLAIMLAPFEYMNTYIYICRYIYIYIFFFFFFFFFFFKEEKGRNYIFPKGRENVVGSFFPLKIFIPLCFNVLSTVQRQNELANSLYTFNK